MSRDVEPHRIDQNKFAHPMCIVNGEFRSYPAAQRKAGDMRLLQAYFIQQIGVVKSQILDRIYALKAVRTPETRMLRNVDCKVAAQNIKKRQPSYFTQQAMKIDKRLSGTRAENSNLRSAHSYQLLVRRHDCSYAA